LIQFSNKFFHAIATSLSSLPSKLTHVCPFELLLCIDSKNSMEDHQDRLQKLLAMIKDDVDEPTLLSYAKDVKEAAKVLIYPFAKAPPQEAHLAL